MIEDEIKTAVVVAEASTKAFGRSVLIGTIPIIEFGLIIMLSVALARVPMMLIRRLE